MKRALLVSLVLASSCSITPADWGFGAMRTMKTPEDPPLKCGTVLPSVKADERTACTYKAKAMPADTLGVTPEQMADVPIRHVIIVMLENRGFDHLLGRLHDQGQPLTDAIPADYANPDKTGAMVKPFHADTTCIQSDPGHQAASMKVVVNGGKMDGFVLNAANTTDTDGHFAVSMYEQTDVPFYYWMASTWALNDRYFSPMVSGTFGNRVFFMFGDNHGVVDTGIVYPDPSTNSIFRELMNAGYTWGAYTDDPKGPLSTTLNWTNTDPGVHSVKDLYDALDNGTLPNVVFIDADEEKNDDHPLADIQQGEKFLHELYTHVTNSPQWNRTAMFWTYDEGGAFFDHVTPPKGCESVPGSPWLDRGVRIPMVVVSPWAKKGFVSHVNNDHTSMTRFIETVFNLPAMTARDANADAFFDMFDFTCGRDLTPPANVPMPGTGGCVK
ncbi:MAG: alkaline phosphatase family protein [Myxococcaceae bacterium]